MAKQRTPTFTPSQDKIGSGWHVDVLRENGVPEQVSGFRSEAEAQDWIDHKSSAWLKEKGRR
jgi:hypothetical protein